MLALMRPTLKPMQLQQHRMETPLGCALLITDLQGALRAIDFIDYESRMLKLLRIHYGTFEVQSAPAPARVIDAFGDYFAGKVNALDVLHCETNGTAFQRRIWQRLRTIPAGRTTTYGELARDLGSPNAARAVGLANGANPLAIIVPCHRLIGADGSLTGYAGGLHRKQWLLNHERACVDTTGSI
jgi:methylated-DNA-[protein]-cysteine S-methyltransferase